MPNRNQQFGKSGERVAATHLKRKGYRILERNYRNPLGEIDIIAREKGVLVFVEVKTRSSARFGSPKRAVTPAKQRQLSKVALAYLKTTRQSHSPARFDVVSVCTEEAAPAVELIRNAFELAYP